MHRIRKENRNILSPSQYGFRKLHSTKFTMHLSIFLYNITRNIDIPCSLSTGGVFLWFREEFESIDHSLLLKTLGNLGILNTIQNISCL